MWGLGFLLFPVAGFLGEMAIAGLADRPFGLFLWSLPLAAGVWLASLFRRQWYVRAQRDAGYRLCSVCMYDLRPLEQDDVRCPECGMACRFVDNRRQVEDVARYAWMKRLYWDDEEVV